MTNTLTLKMKDAITNVLDHRTQLVYIVEAIDWSIKWDGIQITRALKQQQLCRAEIRTISSGLRNKLIHFGSSSTLLSEQGIKNIHSSNKAILSWFHLPDDDKRIAYIPDLERHVSLLHTSCELTKHDLVRAGFPGEKIRVIPLGVDTSIFTPLPQEKRLELRKKLGLPEGKIIIGSFQKDGEGIGQGLTPKYIKGPDVFCDLVEKIATQTEIHVLLTGLSRGYVTQRLDRAHIPYTYVYLNNYYDIADLYNVLDLYLITSRVEGGPKALLESMACGIPFVSTRVGMAPDIIRNQENGLLVDRDDQDALLEKSLSVLREKDMRDRLISNALRTVRQFDWQHIAKRYYDELYADALPK